jgi:Kef-type K+ transport system membrane component KefB
MNKQHAIILGAFLAGVILADYVRKTPVVGSYLKV